MKTAARLALLLVAATAWACSRAEDAPEREPAAAVETAPVTEGPIEERVEALGVVEIEPGRMRAVPFPREGEVERVLVAVGESVAAGAPLVELGPAARKGLASRQARIELEFAERELARVRRLGEEGLAGNAEREAAEKGAASARAALAALGGGHGAPPEPIRAPQPGVVVEVAVARGAWVSAGQLAVSLAPSDALVVRTGFEPEHAERFRANAEMEIIPVFSATTVEPLRAQAEVQSRVDAVTQLVDVRIPVAAPPAWLVVGARVRVRAVTRANEHATLVPSGSLLRRGGTTGVFVVTDGRARWREVAVGARGDDVSEVVTGVASGERVATAGRSSLEDDMPVRVASPRASP